MISISKEGLIKSVRANCVCFKKSQRSCDEKISAKRPNEFNQCFPKNYRKEFFDMKKTVLFLLALLVMMFSFSVPTTYATNETNELSKANAAKTYRVDFYDGIKYDSSAVKSNLSVAADNLVEVVFNVNAGLDTFTIGYYLGESDFSYETITASIQEAIDNINDDIQHNERVSGNRLVLIEDIELSYFEISPDYLSTRTADSIDDLVNKFVGVKDCNLIGTFVSPQTIDESQLASVTYGAINGSYHHIQVVGTETYIGCYNGLTGQDYLCNANLSSPHGGDGNNRYDSGYQWFPNYVDVDFATNVGTNENQTKLWYKYDQATLNNLNIDSNEALEMEVLFYNYTDPKLSVSEKGSTFQINKSGAVWATNQPNSYRDTTFGDSSNTVSFSIGVSDTTSLVANKWYYWYMNGPAGTTANNYPNDGRFKVTAQRSYRLIGSGAFSVFAEEHEAIRTLGVPVGNNWVVKSAWSYAQAKETWHFDSSKDTVK